MTEISKALSQLSKRLTNPGKSGKSHLGKYTELPALLDHIRPVAAELDLFFSQDITVDGIYLLAFHGSGETFRWGPYPLQEAKGPQAQGSLETYGRRYQLMAALGIAGHGEDDEGNKAQKATQTPVREPRLVSAAQMKALQASLRDMDRDARLELVRGIIGRDIESSKELTSQEAAKVLNHVKGGDDGDV